MVDREQAGRGPGDFDFMTGGGEAMRRGLLGSSRNEKTFVR